MAATKTKRPSNKRPAAEVLAEECIMEMADAKTLARCVHDAEVGEFIRQMDEFYTEQPSPEPFQRARDTKGMASVVLAFEFLRKLLPVPK